MRAAFVVLCCAFVLSGCSYATFYRQPGSPEREAGDPREVRLFASRPSGKLTLLGSVAVDVYGDSAKAEERLREQAAELGANAVIYVKASLLNSVGKRAALGGTAVRLE